MTARRNSYQPPEEEPKYKDIIVRKYADRSKGIEIIMPDLWTIVEINAIPSAIRKERRRQYNELRKEGTTNERSSSPESSE